MADDTGWASPHPMLRGMKAWEFLERKAWYDLEPRGRTREEWHWARLLQLLFNVNVTQGKQKSDVKEFLLKFEDVEAQRRQEDADPYAANKRTLLVFKMLANAWTPKAIDA